MAGPRQDVLPAPGWYADPHQRDQQRWWNGAAWTDRIRRGAAPSSDGSSGQAAFISIHCPRCASPDTKRLAVIHAQGTVTGTARSSG